MVAMEQVVVPHAGIEQVAWFDARRIVIDVECRARDINQLRSRLRGIRAADSACAYRKGLRQGSRVHDSTGIDAEKPDGRLLSCIKEPGCILEIVKKWVAGYQTTVVAPVEADPRQGFPWLILEMCRLIEGLVVVDAEDFSTRDAGAQPADLWREIACPALSRHRAGRAAVNSPHAHSNRKHRHLRI